MIRLLVTIVFCLLVISDFVEAGSRDSSPYYQVPSRQPIRLIAERQKDSFSCGFHAVSSVYRSHRLNPELANLRARLGTSVRAIPFVSDSEGTLQPDILRVLQQDGFHAVSIDKFSPEALVEITNHLNKNLYALALFKTERAGGMHWVVMTDFSYGNVTIADSLHRGTYGLELTNFAEEKLLNVILLSPAWPQPGSPYFKAHVAGGRYMATSFWMSLTPLGKVTTFSVLILTVLLVSKLIRLWLARRKRARV